MSWKTVLPATPADTDAPPADTVWDSKGHGCTDSTTRAQEADGNGH